MRPARLPNATNTRTTVCRRFLTPADLHLQRRQSATRRCSPVAASIGRPVSTTIGSATSIRAPAPSYPAIPPAPPPSTRGRTPSSSVAARPETLVEPHGRGEERYQATLAGAQARIDHYCEIAKQRKCGQIWNNCACQAAKNVHTLANSYDW